MPMKLALDTATLVKLRLGDIVKLEREYESERCRKKAIEDKLEGW